MTSKELHTLAKELIQLEYEIKTHDIFVEAMTLNAKQNSHYADKRRELVAKIEQVERKIINATKNF